MLNLLLRAVILIWITLIKKGILRKRKRKFRKKSPNSKIEKSDECQKSEICLNFKKKVRFPRTSLKSWLFLKFQFFKNFKKKIRNSERKKRKSYISIISTFFAKFQLFSRNFKKKADTTEITEFQLLSNIWIFSRKIKSEKNIEIVEF